MDVGKLCRPAPPHPVRCPKIIEQITPKKLYGGTDQCMEIAIKPDVL